MRITGAGGAGGHPVRGSADPTSAMVAGRSCRSTRDRTTGYARDLVSYNDKHNELNLEDNTDGTDDNRSWNGVRGPGDIRVLGARARQQRNFLTTLLLSGRPDAARRRRDGPEPGGQQQRVLPGQRDLLVPLGPRAARRGAARLHPAAGAVPARPPRGAARHVLRRRARRAGPAGHLVVPYRWSPHGAARLGGARRTGRDLPERRCHPVGDAEGRAGARQLPAPAVQRPLRTGPVRSRAP